MNQPGVAVGAVADQHFDDAASATNTGLSPLRFSDRHRAVTESTVDLMASLGHPRRVGYGGGRAERGLRGDRRRYGASGSGLVGRVGNGDGRI
jgi:hypothetical protein